MASSASCPVIVVREGSVAVIEIDSPPVNALAHAVREPLLTAVEVLDADPAVRAIVIVGRGKHFIAGADIREFDAAPRAPFLHDVLSRIEAATKPVVAAIHGTTLGGGAELALACHYRCASRDLSFGFPEVKLGLIPGSGGTVRLPRICGLTRSLELMASGQPIGLEQAVEAKLIDEVADAHLRAAAVAFAAARAKAAQPVRRTRSLDVPARETPDLFTRFRERLSAAQRRSGAVERLIEALEAAEKLPFDAAMVRARELFVECRDSVPSRALRHLFLAERGSAATSDARAVRAIGVVGAGTMGSGIAISALTAGYSVTLVDTNDAAVAAGRERISSILAEQLKKGRLSAEAAEAAAARLSSATGLDALAGVDLVIEAVFESLEVKQTVFGQLASVCRTDTVLATNTSTLDVDAIAAAAGARARDVVGMHFFSPANVMRLVEVVHGKHSALDAIATTLAVTKRLGKIGVLVGNGYGFVGNRMLYAYGREKELMLLEGVAPERIDRALEGFGMAMGPNAVGDLAGLDIGFHARKGWKEKPDDPRFYRASDLLAEHGRFGQKTGRGFYRYEPGARRGVPDPEAVALIAAEAQRLGIVPRNTSDEEIVDRCILALVNEGARLIDAGIAASAADIDVIWCNGYGFPRDRGGPMFYADTCGLDVVLARIREYAKTLDERYWQAAALLEKLAAEGRSFAAFDAAQGVG